MRRIAGIAALGYVAGVSIENMELIEAPTLGSSAADIRAHYADHALAVVTSVAGAAALVFYAAFVAALFGIVRARERPGEAWSAVALVGGIGGPMLAAAGLAASSIIVAEPGASLSDDVIGALSDFSLQVRIVSGLFVALFLVGIGVAAVRSGALPASLAWAACAISIPFALAPPAAFTGNHGLEVAVTVAFGLQTTWMLLAGLWLSLADGIAPATLVRRAAFLTLALAAALTGVALLAVPGATGQFFSWGLGPEPLAAFAGGVYVGSAAAYAAALPRDWLRVRGLVVGAAVLSVSVFVVTLAHLDQFDFDRMQAWAWVALFAGFSLLTVGLLAVAATEAQDRPTGGTSPRIRQATQLPTWTRLALFGIAAALAALALALWIHPSGLSGASPFELTPLGGSFAGCWIALIAAVTAWAAVRNTTQEARLPVLVMVALATGALIAALRTISDLHPAAEAAAYLAGLTLLAALGALLLTSMGRARSDR
jgi:hypothetical protein